MSIGTDIIEISRIEKSINTPRFLERVFSLAELELFRTKKNAPAMIAGRFCVKEAFGKALGTGIRDFELTDVTTLNNELGAPYIILAGNAKKLLGNRSVSVSISHCKLYATATVLIYC
ncbi:MAG: holo-ACP synthase [Oscillospiraceae bacterium]|jgi:holo-[acyl-carrier protein] synthase|nr:holo-ACP synthase [Oscillospiraceae bacterium]